MPLLRAGIVSLVVLANAVPALAACPIELAVYSSGEGKAGIDFSPRHEAGATVTNSFTLVLNDMAIPGHVQWSAEQPRPFGALGLNCPGGDATGAELESCTVWQGVIYSAGADGVVGLLPVQGVEAPPRLIFSGLGPALAASAALAGRQLPASDIFELSGCQE